MGKTLLQKVWDLHTVRRLPTGQTQLFVGLHLIHEVTTPQAFDMLRARDITVAFPDRTFATTDHIVPTLDQGRPFQDPLAEALLAGDILDGSTVPVSAGAAGLIIGDRVGNSNRERPDDAVVH